MQNLQQNNSTELQVTQPTITTFDQSINLQYQVQEESESDEEPQQQQIVKPVDFLQSRYTQQKKNLVVEKINEEQEEYEDSADQNLFLQSVAYNNQRFTTDSNTQKTYNAEITMTSVMNGVLYYVIEVESSIHRYSVKRRYNDFKKLIKELTQRYVDLILPYIPVGVKYQKLSDKDLDERKRILQNSLRIICLHQEIVNSNTLRNFLEQETLSEFELFRRNNSQVDQNYQILDNVKSLFNTGFKNFSNLSKWWSGSGRNLDSQLQELDTSIQKIQKNKQNLVDMLASYQAILLKQLQIDQAHKVQELDKQLFSQEIKLDGCLFDFGTALHFQISSVESKTINIYEQHIYNLSNLIDFINYVMQYYAKIIQNLKDLDDRMGKVTPNQSKQIQEDIQKFISKATQQICTREGIYNQYMTKYFTTFCKEAIDSHIELLQYAVNKLQ